VSIATTRRMTGLEPLLQPGQIGGMTLRNRVVQAPIFTQYATTWGEASRKLIEYHRARARGGVGLIILENTSIDWEVGRTVGNPARLDHDRFRTALGELTEAVHNEGGRIAAQLHHTGRQNTRGNIETGEMPVSASDGPASLFGDPPRGLTLAEIPGIIDKYAQAGRRAVLAGFDAVEIHGAHGYLPGQFLSPKTNRRDDHYGGSLENRARFALELVDAVREQVGPEYPILYRLSVEEPYEGGLTLEDGLAFCEMLQHKVQALDVSAGNYDTVDTLIPLVPPGSLIHYAKAVKQRVSVPVIGVGRMVWKLQEGAQAIADGELDFVALGRGQLADPSIVNKIRSGEPERIRKCIACNECIGVMFQGLRTPCTVNPELGFEDRLPQDRLPVVASKQVTVVGAGAAGCEAAVVAAQRGHRVTLVERQDRIGGQLRAWSTPSFRAMEIEELIGYYERELALAGVDVRLGAELDPTTEADVVLLATGTVAGALPAGAVDAEEMLRVRRLPDDEQVLVVGDGTVAAHAALWLAANGRTVQLHCPAGAVAADVNLLLASHLANELERGGVAVQLGGEQPDVAGALIWAGPRKPDTLLGDREDGTRVLAIGTRLRGGLLYAATQSGYWTGARV
jgi:dimethylglycine catabolism A